MSETLSRSQRIQQSGGSISEAVKSGDVSRYTQELERKKNIESGKSYIVTKSDGTQVLRTTTKDGTKPDEAVVLQPKNTYKVVTSDGRVVYRTQPNAQGRVEEIYANPVEIKEGKDTFIVTGNEYQLPVREKVRSDKREVSRSGDVVDLSVLGNLPSDYDIVRKQELIKLNVLRKGEKLLEKPRKALSRLTGGRGEKVTGIVLPKIESRFIKGYEGYKEKKGVLVTNLKSKLPSVSEQEIIDSLESNKLTRKLPKSVKRGVAFLNVLPSKTIVSVAEKPVVTALEYSAGKYIFKAVKGFKGGSAVGRYFKRNNLLSQYGGRLIGGALTVAYIDQVVKEGKKELNSKGTLSDTTANALREVGAFCLGASGVKVKELKKVVGIKGSLTSKEKIALNKLSRNAKKVLEKSKEIVDLKAMGKRAEGRFISKAEIRKRNIARQSGRETYQQKTGRKFTRSERRELYSGKQPVVYDRGVPSGKIRVVSFDRKSLVMKQVSRDVPSEPKKFILKEVGENKIFIKKGKSIVGKIETPIRKLDYIKERIEIKQDVKVASGNQFLLKRIKFEKGKPVGISQKQILVEPRVTTRNVQKLLRRQYILKNKSLKLVSEQKVKPEFYQRQEVKLVGREKVKAKLMQSLYKQRAKLEEDRGLVGFRELFKEQLVKPKVVKAEVEVYTPKRIIKVESNMGGLAKRQPSINDLVILEEEYKGSLTRGFNKIDDIKIRKFLSKDKIVTVRNFGGVFKTSPDLSSKSKLAILPLLSFDKKSDVKLDIASKSKEDVGFKISSIPKLDVASKLRSDVDVREIQVQVPKEITKPKGKVKTKQKVKPKEKVVEQIREVVKPKIIPKIKPRVIRVPKPKPPEERKLDFPSISFKKKKFKILKFKVKKFLTKQKTAYTITLVSAKKRKNLKYYSGLEYR